MLAGLQIRDFQSNRASLRLHVEKATNVAAGHTACVRGQVNQAVHLDQVDLARIRLDTQLAIFEVAHADAPGIGLDMGGDVARHVERGPTLPAAEPVERALRIQRYPYDVAQLFDV